MEAVDMMGRRRRREKKKTFSQMNKEREVGGAPLQTMCTLVRTPSHTYPSVLFCVPALKRDVQDWQWLMGIGTAANYEKNRHTSQRWNIALARSLFPSLCLPPHLALAHDSTPEWMSCTSVTFSPDYFSIKAAVITDGITWFLHAHNESGVVQVCVCQHNLSQNTPFRS